MNVILTQFHPHWGIPNISPYCLKVETFLKMSKISYKTKLDFDPRKGPKGLFPFIEYQDKKIGDSKFIIDFLTKTFNITIDSHLNKEKIAISDAFKSLLEEDLISCILYSRWADDRFFPTIKHDLFSGLPLPLRLIIPKVARSRIVKRLTLNGTLGHSKDEIYQLGSKHIRTCADFLGDKPYFMGDKMSSIDATVFAFLLNCGRSKINTPLKEEALKHANITAYCDRIMTEFYS